ncbi:efflux RND transporter periplasmic adaptor subunit [Tateyamaria pelophila]|uniref:efflux RND transporter periplasmic adaptor subunit n=1 Tax=Tateyamaria pelophila TaxID=328415 RepID=UPI001CC13929|nr:efflux RND transporter periplasmic adaptor subunit [Tateyamaria pelophila]
MKRLVIFISTLTILAACREEPEPISEPIRPVRVILAQSDAGGETVTLTGDIRAQDTVTLGFRTSGRVVNRFVDVGDSVEPAQLLARLEDTTQRNAIAAAQAEVQAAEGDADRAETDYERNAQLLERGFNTQQRYDVALQTLRQARARADAARANLANAQEALAFTALYADASGVVTATGAEPGEVVAAGAMVVRMARDNGRDAVFDVPERLIQSADPTASVQVALVSDNSAVANGLVREVAPQADAVTRTFLVRVGLSDVPDSFRLGSAVTGSLELAGLAATPLPATALTTMEGDPAVFIVDPGTGIVELRKVEIGRFDIAEVWVTQGIADGETVVTAGVQTLRPGQEVRVGEGR